MLHAVSRWARRTRAAAAAGARRALSTGPADPKNTRAPRGMSQRAVTAARLGAIVVAGGATYIGLRGKYAAAPAKAESANSAAAVLPVVAAANDGAQPESVGVRRLKTSKEIQNRFNAFASFEREGQRMMTVEDFCRSLNLDPKSANARALFDSADAHHDGGVSLADYASFVSMLHSSDAEMKVAFAMFDLNGDGKVTAEEFSTVVNSRIAGPDFPFQLDSALMRRFFGADGKRTLNWREFKLVLDSLEREVLRATFAKFDPRNAGRIPLSALLSYLDAQTASGWVPKHVRENLYARSQQVGSEVTFDQFWALHSFLRDIDTIEATLQRVIQGDGAKGRDGVTKAEFRDALRTYLGVNKAVRLDASAGVEGVDGAELALGSVAAEDPFEVDVVFRIFSKANDPDVLDHRQFAAWVKSGKHGELPKMTIWESFALSGASAMIGATCVFPIDKIKTRLQTSAVPGASMLSTAQEIVRKEGLLRMYRGLQAQLIGITPEKALKLTSNQFFVDQLKARAGGRDLTFAENALSGVLTGCVQISLTNPVEIVKIRLQMQRHGADIKSPFAVVRDLGIRGLYTGLPATALRDLPFNAMYFSLYPYLKHQFADEKGELSSVRVLGASMGAGVIAAALDTPADTIKTRLQAGQTRYSGIIDCVKKTYAEEGLRAFTKGLAPRVLIISPLFGITFAVFEKLQRWLLPMKRVPLAIIQDDFNAVRRSRLQQIDAQLAIKYGLKSSATNANGAHKLPPAPANPTPVPPSGGAAGPSAAPKS